MFITSLLSLLFLYPNPEYDEFNITILSGSNGFSAPGLKPGPAIGSYIFTNSTSLLTEDAAENDDTIPTSPVLCASPGLQLRPVASVDKVTICCFNALISLLITMILSSTRLQRFCRTSASSLNSFSF